MELLRNAERPALVIGSQTMVNCSDAGALAHAVEALGHARVAGRHGSRPLGRSSPLQFRHARGKALKEADVVLVCGFPFDFRLKYGLGISKKAKVVAANLSPVELTQEPPARHRAPDARGRLPGAARQKRAPARPEVGRVARRLPQARGRSATRRSPPRRGRERDLVDPMHFFLRLEEKLADDAVLVVDGGDFVATAAYIVRPRKPLSWLDPGVFGTLGVGGGFAVGAAAVRPKAEVWIL